jgi:hypothetical protein
MCKQMEGKISCVKRNTRLVSQMVTSYGDRFSVHCSPLQSGTLVMTRNLVHSRVQARRAPFTMHIYYIPACSENSDLLKE